VSFSTFDASAAGYWALGKDLVLVAEARYAVSSDNAPFFMKPFVSIRGFPSGRYLGDVVAQGQAELRWNVWKRFGVVGFGGVGAVSPEGSIFSGSDVAGAYGAGLRYRISNADRMNVGFDIAFGGDEPAYYFSIGEAF
jgi:hypothetical protein